MKSPNIRQNFYQGQNILAKDLNALQDYSDTNKNLLVSELLGSGILHGFEITKKEGFTISISPGVAFDKNGTRLILEELTDITLTPPTATPEESKSILLGIKLSYNGSEPIKDSLDNETPTRFTPSVEIITGENLDEEVFPLASITLDENAITDITTIKNKFAYHQHIKDLIYPINYQYTQYPDKTTGLFREEDSPKNNIGGDWELVETKIYNNVPIVEPNEFGVMSLYPDRTATFVSKVEGFVNNTIVTFPAPFIKEPTISIQGVGASVPLKIYAQYIVNTQLAVNSMSATGYITESEGVPKTRQQAIGHWKDPADPISSDEEKWYVKIWQRIAPTTEV